MEGAKFADWHYRTLNPQGMTGARWELGTLRTHSSGIGTRFREERGDAASASSKPGRSI